MPENGAVLHIIIRVCMENNRLLISVYDDGKGILPEKVKELNDIFSGKSADTGNSIGLPNLASRLKILYQGEIWSVSGITGRSVYRSKNGTSNQKEGK